MDPWSSSTVLEEPRPLIVLWIKIFQEPCTLTFSSPQYHQGVVLLWSSYKRRSSRCKSGLDKMLCRCCPILNWKEWKDIIKRKSQQAAVRIFCYENVLQDPKGWDQILYWCNTFILLLAYGCSDPLINKKILVSYVITYTK